MDKLKIFGANVRHYRKRLHLSQEQLAEKLNINTSNIVKVESGKQFVSATVLYKMAEVLQVSVSDLFREDTPTTSSQTDSNKQKLLKYVSTLTEDEAQFAFESIKIFQKHSKN